MSERDDPSGRDDSPSALGFEILSDETRLAILDALAERLRERPGDPVLGFADLRRRVGRRDSGNFNYHLDRLEGRFVTRTDDGYRIAPAGVRVVAALIAGLYGAGERRGPRGIDDRCPVCHEPLTASYENGVVRVACDDDHVFRNSLPPGAVDERAVEEVVELLTLTTHQQVELAVEGVCPFCYGRLSWSVDPELDGEMAMFETQCSRCGVMVDVPPGLSLLRHPAVVSFYYDHGIDARKRPLWAPEFYNAVRVSASTDPTRVHVVVELDGDELEATLDGDLSIREVHRGT